VFEFPARSFFSCLALRALRQSEKLKVIGDRRQQRIKQSNVNIVAIFSHQSTRNHSHNLSVTTSLSVKAKPPRSNLQMSMIPRRVPSSLTNRAFRKRAAFSADTYYDSQSGLHVPIHKEKIISVFLDVSREPTSPHSFVPAQFYKEDMSSDVPDKLRALVQEGITGLWLPPVKFPRDLRNLQTLHHIAPPNFNFFVCVESPLSESLERLSAIHEFSMTDDRGDLKDKLKKHVDNGTKTTLRLGRAVCGDSDSVSVASQLATLIDSTGGANYLWLTPPDSADEDDVIELCEELMYLDVAGPTIQSRIIIDSIKEAVIDETMLAGINKYVIEDYSHIDIIQDVAKAQGKELVLP
jgi:hypothetical protein